jgi:hypothetical protein
VYISALKSGKAFVTVASKGNLRVMLLLHQGCRIVSLLCFPRFACLGRFANQSHKIAVSIHLNKGINKDSVTNFAINLI